MDWEPGRFDVNERAEVELKVEVDTAVVGSIIKIVAIANCVCVGTGIGFSIEVGSALCIESEVEIAICWVVPVDAVFAAGDEAHVTARSAAVQLVPEIVFMLIVVESIATFCPKLKT